jgi:hypothetical protein
MQTHLKDIGYAQIENPTSASGFLLKESISQHITSLGFDVLFQRYVVTLK